MSHFVGIVIIPIKEKNETGFDLDEFLENALLPFSEETKGEEIIEHNWEQIKEEFDKVHLNIPASRKTKIKWAEEKYGYESDDEGNLVSYSNPNSFYDWYSVGGRWDGELTGNKGDNIVKVSQIIDGFNQFENQDKTLKLVSKIDGAEEYNKFLFHKVVADGEDYGDLNFGWFGSSESTQEENEWKKEYLEILEELHGV